MLTELEILAIKCASQGLTSTPLSQWPVLVSAFNKMGLNLDPKTSGYAIKKVAQSLLNKIQ